MDKFKVGQRVTAGGKPGKVVATAKFADVYPDVVQLQGLRRRPRAAPVDPDSVVVTVQLDGEKRPRNFPASEVKGGE